VVSAPSRLGKQCSATYQYVDWQVASGHVAIVAEGELQRTVGKALRQVRREHGLSQEEFALMLGVHRTYLGAIERGERNLTLRSVERLAERAGVESDLLLAPIDGAM